MSQPWYAASPTVSSGLRPSFWLRVTAPLVVAVMAAGCGSPAVTPTAPAESPDPVSATVSPEPTDPEESAERTDPAEPAAPVERPEWFGLEMTDVQTGEAIAIDDYAGQVVLVETMAIWCPTCRKQGDEVKRLHELLGDPEDLVSISLDVDMSEDAAMLKSYAEKLGYDWHFAVAPLLVARALGNEYSAQYLNPPVSPMLVIDKEGNVLGLPFGSVKSAEGLRGVVEPLLEA